jgi:hypothetical protein
MQGGMIMVGDMFNTRLQGTVGGLCSELSALLRSQQVFVPLPVAQSGAGSMAPGNSWWPAELGQPSSSGGQNDARYAYFPHVRRLAVEQGGQIKIFDTLDHQIGGVQQQQGGFGGSLSFSSQYGTFTVESLPLVSPLPPQPAPPAPPQGTPVTTSGPPELQGSAPSASANTAGPPLDQERILATLEQLGQLHQKGVLSDDEFRSKKAELLSRL